MKTFDEVHQQVRTFVVFAHVEHRDHVRMTHEARDPRFVEEHSVKGRIFLMLCVKPFEDAQAFEARAAPHGEQHASHAPVSELP